MFAFAIFDSRARTLFLARDHLGIKPLYYTRLPCGGLAFASEIRALIAGGAASAKLSREGLASYFTFGSVSSPQTILDGVFTLEPGCSLTIRDATLEFATFWRIPSGEADPAGPTTEATSELRQHLTDAMRLCLVSDVPVGIFLSGGVDSSALVALGSQVSTIPINTFTVIFDELKYSEERFATEVAQRFGSEHHSIHLSAARALNEIDSAIRAMDQPSVDGANTYFVAAAVREAGLKVALSGLGGDEIFAGYPHFRTFGPACKFSSLVHGRWARSALRSLSGMTEWLPSRWRKLAALGDCAGDPGAIYAVLRSIYVPAERRRLMMSPLGEDAAHCKVRMRSNRDSDPVNTYSAFELSNYLRNTLLRDTDTMSMAHALEVRVPFLDHKVVEYAFRIHGSAKLRNGVNKPSLVDAVPELPTQSVNRPKMGFSLPLDAWCRGPLKTWFKAHVLEIPERLPGLFNREALDTLWRSFEQEQNYLSLARVWSIAMLSSWATNNKASL
jgi:asparagine synthase (glutamine-hydrolysing)